MGLIYTAAVKHYKKNLNKIFYSDLQNSISGSNCIELINSLIELLEKNNIKSIALCGNNSIYWPLWYVAADKCCHKIFIIKSSFKKSLVSKIIKTNNVEFFVNDLNLIKSKKNKLIKAKCKIINKCREDIVFTTGSTNGPKGVIVSENSFVHVAKLLNKKFKQSEKDHELLSMPFDHSFGLARLRCCLLSGSRGTITQGMSNFPKVFQYILKDPITGLSLVPAGIVILRKMLKLNVKRIAKELKYFEIGSSSICIETRIWLKKNFHSTKILHHYGMTEASRSFLKERGNRDDLRKPINEIGKVIDGCKFKILYDNRFKKNNFGELMISGKNLFSRYLNKNDMKNKFFQSWYKTGDICRIKNGNVLLLGRIDNMFNIGGNKVLGDEIEDIMESVNFVFKCLCFSKNDPIMGQKINCIIELKNKSSKNEVLNNINNLFTKFPAYYKPSKIIFDKVPLTNSGKKIRSFIFEDL